MPKAKLVTMNKVKYLSFTPDVDGHPLTCLPVITSGSRNDTNAWTWNGCLEKPTIKPSVRTYYANEKGDIVELHYWLTDGVCHCLPDCTDGNAGNILQLEIFE